MEAAGTRPAPEPPPRCAPRPPASSIAARILENEERTRHDVIAFLTHVEELAGEPARWLHLGMTSSDVLDASLAIQLVEAADEILAGLDLLRAACRRRAEEHRATPAIGRSHGIHAEPITAGLVFAGFYAELGRARARAGRGPRRRSRSARSRAPSAPTPTSTRRSRRGAGRRSACAPRRCRRRSSPAIATPPTSRRWRGWAPRSSGWRSPCATGSAPRSARRGGLRQGPEGLLGDAAQEEPDPVREPVRARAPAARLRIGGARERRAVARARHLALVGRARDRPRRDRAWRTSWCAARPAWSTVWSSTPRACASNLELTGGPLLQRGGDAGAGAQGDGAPAGLRAGAAQRAARRGGRGDASARCSRADPEVAAA